MIRSIILSFLVKHPERGYFLCDTGLSRIDAETRTDYQKEYFPIEVDACELFPGVQLFGMTGHTPGGPAMLLECGNRNDILPGDSD